MADQDLEHLFDILLNRAETAEDLDGAQAVIKALRVTNLQGLAIASYIFSKSGEGRRITLQDLMAPATSVAMR